MRAAVLTEYGKPLHVSELPDPVPGPGEVLVRVMASGVNPLDIKIRRGEAAHAQMVPPAVLGIDMAGVVQAVGDGVDRFRIGDEVFGMTGGVGGCRARWPNWPPSTRDRSRTSPDALSMPQAAALPLGFITSWEGLVDRAGVGAGEQVLVHGGAGGVGFLAVQLAIARGARVYATGSASSQEIIGRIGATPIDYTASTVDDYVDAHTGGEGFDIVVDNVGGATLDALVHRGQALHRTRRQRVGLGHSQSGAVVVPWSHLFGRLHVDATAERPRPRTSRTHRRARRPRWPTAVSWSPRLHPTTFPLDEVNDAHAIVENGSATGKVVVTPGA